MNPNHLFPQISWELAFPYQFSDSLLRMVLFYQLYVVLLDIKNILNILTFLFSEKLSYLQALIRKLLILLPQPGSGHIIFISKVYNCLN